MKKMFFIVASVAFSIVLNAQDSSMSNQDNYGDKSNTGYKTESATKTFIWSIGVEPSMPVGNFHNFSSFGLGGSLQGEIKPGNKVGITINAGYIDYFGKSVDTIKYSDFKYWPVMGGLKYYMSARSYLHGQAGAGFGSKGLGTSFWYGGGIGFNLSKAIDAELRYTGWKQNEVSKSTGTYQSGTGTGGTGGTGGGYGGHYSTIGVRVAVNF